MIRVRFAPSPTGYLHIGGLRTALYDYLFAKKNNGKYILRIEDTDRSRFVEGSIENLIKSLEWAGVKHDEGVFIENGKLVEKGEYGPYIQSKRLEIYKEYIDKLLSEEKAYHCFCSKERLEKVKEKQKAEKGMLGYDGHCRNLTKEEVKNKIDSGEEYVIRLKLPENTDIKFKDLVRGDITVNTKDLDDQVLMKSDGFPTYHLAAVVDDYLMKITHIVRGEEWLPSAPKHTYLFNALGLEAPIFVHLPTVLNKEKKKLSKRQGDVAVEDFKKNGYLPEGLINYLALIGWSPEDNQEFFTTEELIEAFSFERVSKTGGIFDKDKLDWVNAHYIRNLTDEELMPRLLPYLKEANRIKENTTEDWLLAVTSVIKDRISTLKEAPEVLDIFLKDEFEFESEEVKIELKESKILDILQVLKSKLEDETEINQEFSKNILKSIQKETGIKGKELFMPSRIALTGKKQGPDLDKVILVLGKENILKRIDYIQSIF